MGLNFRNLGLGKEYEGNDSLIDCLMDGTDSVIIFLVLSQWGALKGD